MLENIQKTRLSVCVRVSERECADKCNQTLVLAEVAGR